MASASTNPLTLAWRAQASMGTPNANWYARAGASGSVVDMRLGTPSGNWAVAPMDPDRHLESANEPGGYVSGVLQGQFGSFGSMSDIHGRPIAGSSARSPGPTDRDGWQSVSGTAFKVQKASGIPYGGIKFGAKGYLHLRRARSERYDGEGPDKLFVRLVKELSDTVSASGDMGPFGNVRGYICPNPRNCVDGGFWDLDTCPWCSAGLVPYLLPWRNVTCVETIAAARAHAVLLLTEDPDNFKENDTGFCQAFEVDDSRSSPSASSAMPVAKAEAEAKAATMGAVRLPLADGSVHG